MNHKEIETSVGMVDEGIAPLIEVLNRKGLETVCSCEDTDGGAYVSFSTDQDAFVFFKRIYPHLEGASLTAGKQHCAEVRFDPEDMELVTELARTL